MAEKKKPIGICDHCGKEMPEALHYTTKGMPRLYCSRECRNTANSRAGAHIRSKKGKERVRRGEWKNPHHLNPPSPEEQARRARLGRKREVKEGRWRNPAKSPEARRKLSRPRKHSGELHSAIEKLGQGSKMEELTEEEQQAYRAYRRQLYAKNQDYHRDWRRKWWRKRWEEMSEEEREKQRAKWRAANHRRQQRKSKKG